MHRGVRSGAEARTAGLEVVREGVLEALILQAERADDAVFRRIVVGVGHERWPAVGAVE